MEWNNLLKGVEGSYSTTLPPKINQFCDFVVHVVSHVPCFGYGAVEQAGEGVSKDDVKLEESFDEEYEEQETEDLSRAI